MCGDSLELKLKLPQRLAPRAAVNLGRGRGWKRALPVSARPKVGQLSWRREACRHAMHLLSRHTRSVLATPHRAAVRWTQAQRLAYAAYVSPPREPANASGRRSGPKQKATNLAVNSIPHGTPALVALL